MNALSESLGLSHHLNYAAVLVCGLVNFVIGGLWYSPALFAGPWVRAAKLNTRTMDRSGMGAMYAGAAASGILVALCLAYLIKIGDAGTVKEALRLAWTCWVGFIAAASLGDYLFLRRGLTLYLINSGVHLVTFSVSAIILVKWT